MSCLSEMRPVADEPMYIHISNFSGTAWLSVDPADAAESLSFVGAGCLTPPDLACTSTAPSSAPPTPPPGIGLPGPISCDVEDFPPLPPPPSWEILGMADAEVMQALAKPQHLRWPISPASSVSTAVPTSPTEEAQSHAAGTCKPCLYFSSGLCHKATACTFCHEPHDRRQLLGVRPSKRTRTCLERRVRRATNEGQDDAPKAPAQRRGEPRSAARSAAEAARARAW